MAVNSRRPPILCSAAATGSSPTSVQDRRACRHEDVEPVRWSCGHSVANRAGSAPWTGRARCVQHGPIDVADRPDRGRHGRGACRTESKKDVAAPHREDVGVGAGSRSLTEFAGRTGLTDDPQRLTDRLAGRGSPVRASKLDPLCFGRSICPSTSAPSAVRPVAHAVTGRRRPSVLARRHQRGRRCRRCRILAARRSWHVVHAEVVSHPLP